MHGQVIPMDEERGVGQPRLEDAERLPVKCRTGGRDARAGLGLGRFHAVTLQLASNGLDVGCEDGEACGSQCLELRELGQLTFQLRAWLRRQDLEIRSRSQRGERVLRPATWMLTAADGVNARADLQLADASVEIANAEDDMIDMERRGGLREGCGDHGQE